MLEAEDEAVLNQARAWKDEGEPGWGSAKWAWVFVVGGLALGALDLAFGDAPGMGPAFILGAGLVAVVIHVLVGRYVRRCYRLIRFADARGAFADDRPPA